MQLRRQIGQKKGLYSKIIYYNGFLCKNQWIEVWIKIMDYNQF